MGLDPAVGLDLAVGLDSAVGFDPAAWLPLQRDMKSRKC